MKISIAIETEGTAPQADNAVPLVIDGGALRQHDVNCRPSANFVAHLVATLLQAPQTRARRRGDLHDAIRLYDDATAPKLTSPGAGTCCKT